jgi:hypothetical protein
MGPKAALDGVYGARTTMSATIKVRDSGSKKIVSEYKWSYTYQNFSGEKPSNVPVRSMMEDPKTGLDVPNNEAGLYAAEGIDIKGKSYDKRKK